MLPSYFEFYMPVKILSGKNALDSVPLELKAMNALRPGIITDKGVVQNGLLRFVEDALRAEGVTPALVFDETPSDSSLSVVSTIAELFRKNSADSIIAVGGGSVIDTAKGVNILLTENITDLNAVLGVDRLTKPQKPFIVIPTTSGTGSEVTTVAVISDAVRKMKMLFQSNVLLPNAAVLDPRMTLSLPPFLTAATGMDALTHAVEAFYCLQKNPVSDAFAGCAISLVRQYLMKAVEDGKNEAARSGMAAASLLAGIAFSNSMVGAVHGIGHAVGAVCHTHHGNTMAILLPWVMEFNYEKSHAEYAELLLPLAGAEIYSATPPDMRARKTIDVIRTMNKLLHEKAKMPVTLSQAGVTKEQFDAIAKTALNDGALITNPCEVEYADILAILERAF